MSPLVQPPNRGYADWQRVENYDSGVLLAVNQLIGGLPVTFGPVDMSRYLAIGGLMGVSGNAGLVQMFWYDDSSALALVGQRQFTLSPLIPLAAQLRIPNLGPFLEIAPTWLAGGSMTFVCNLIGTNRDLSMDFIPSAPLLIDQDAVALGASGAVISYPNSYYAGPVRLWFTCTQSALWQLQVLSPTNAWETVDEFELAGGGVTSTTNILTPPGAWRIVVTNETAVAATYYLKATPSTTGAT